MLFFLRTHVFKYNFLWTRSALKLQLPSLLKSGDTVIVQLHTATGTRSKSLIRSCCYLIWLVTSNLWCWFSGNWVSVVEDYWCWNLLIRFWGLKNATSLWSFSVPFSRQKNKYGEILHAASKSDKFAGHLYCLYSKGTNILLEFLPIQSYFTWQQTSKVCIPLEQWY